MQRQDNILEWIFLIHKQKKNQLKTYIEKISELVIKGQIRLYQLSGIDIAEIMIHYTNAEIMQLLRLMAIGKELVIFS